MAEKTHSAKNKGKDFSAMVSRASATPDTLGARFAHAKTVLAEKPTGFSELSPERTSFAAPAKVETDAKGRKIYLMSVSVDLIDENPYNARRVYKVEKIAELAASMSVSGQLVPGLGTMRNGRCICVAGNYRHRAIKKAGIATMDIMIHEDLTDHELYELSFKENNERSDQSALDNALVWRKLIDDRLYADETAIANAIGQSLPNVNKTLSVLKLNNEILDLVQEAPELFSLSALYELYLLGKVADHQTTFDMAIKIREGEAGRKDCSNLRASLETPRSRKQKESSRQYKISKDGQPVGVLKDWDSGKIALEIKVTDHNERTAMVAKLKTLFGLAD